MNVLSGSASLACSGRTATLGSSPGGIPMSAPDEEVFCHAGESPLPAALVRRGILTAGAQGQKEKAAEAASAYVNVRSRSAALHRCPTDHTDRAYRRRPELSNPDGRAIHRRRIHIKTGQS
jgi:hypothetical protein